VIGIDHIRRAKKFLECKPDGRRKMSRNHRLKWLEDTENDS
jgi:hypothetical protein